MEVVLVEKPEKKGALKLVNFRCPPEELAWLESLRGHGEDKLDLSVVIRWAIELGHEFSEALGENGERLRMLARVEGRTRGAFVARLLEAALASYEREPQNRVAQVRHGGRQAVR